MTAILNLLQTVNWEDVRMMNCFSQIYCVFWKWRWYLRYFFSWNDDICDPGSKETKHMYNHHSDSQSSNLLQLMISICTIASFGYFFKSGRRTCRINRALISWGSGKCLVPHFDTSISAALVSSSVLYFAITFYNSNIYQTKYFC